MSAEITSLLSTSAVGLLIAFIIYRRVRRTIGRQPFQPTRLKVRTGLFALLGVILLASHPAIDSFEAAMIGAAAGVGLGFYALRHTLFESTPDGRFYTPNLYIGLGVVALFIGRIGYRFATGGMSAPGTGGAPSNPFAQMAASPITLGVFFVMVGYYIFYYSGIINRLQRAEPLAE